MERILVVEIRDDTRSRFNYHGRVISAVEGRKKGGKHPESRLNDTRSILYIFMARDDVCFVERRLASCARSYRR